LARRSRISSSSTSLRGGGGGAAGVASLGPCKRVSTLIIQKTAKLTIRKLDYGIEENADVQGHGASLLRIGKSRRRLTLQSNKDVGEVDAADDQADDRGEDVFDEAVHDAGERDADDDPDGEVDHIAAHDERTEFIDLARRPDAE